MGWINLINRRDITKIWCLMTQTIKETIWVSTNKVINLNQGTVALRTFKICQMNNKSSILLHICNKNSNSLTILLILNNRVCSFSNSNKKEIKHLEVVLMDKGRIKERLEVGSHLQVYRHINITNITTKLIIQDS